LRAEILNKESEKAGAVVDDAVVFTLIQKLIRQRQEAAEQFDKGGRPELAQKEREETKILEEYLPPPLSEAEIRDILIKVVAETGAVSIRDMGKVMGAAMKQLKDTGKLFDGKQVNLIVKEILSGEK